MSSTDHIRQAAFILAKNWGVLNAPPLSLGSAMHSLGIVDVFTTHPSFREKFVEHYEYHREIRILRDKREWLRTRGYPVIEQLDECNEKIWTLVAQQTKRDKDYEMIRRLFAYEIPELKFTG